MNIKYVPARPFLQSCSYIFAISPLPIHAAEKLVAGNENARNTRCELCLNCRLRNECKFSKNFTHYVITDDTMYTTYVTVFPLRTRRRAHIVAYFSSDRFFR